MPFQAPRALLRLDAALRLGPRPLLWLGWHRARMASGVVGRALADAAGAEGSFLPHRAPEPPVLPHPDWAHADWAHADWAHPDWAPVLAAVRALPPVVVHGPFDPSAPALSLDLFAPGDVRPVWEANRLAWLLPLVQAHRLEPGEGHLARAEARLGEWCRANPPFRGPNWACGQEAALRALHLCLSAALLEEEVPPSLAALLRLHARRIGAARAYALAQDNNHGVSEAAGLLAIAWALGDVAGARRAGRGLAAVLARLVASDGGFAQVSTGYHRLLLDTLSVVEWLRRHHGAEPLPEPFGARAAAAARWLVRVMDPATGAVPRLGHQDGSPLADLSLRGPSDARGSAERAARLFLGRSAGVADDPGCAWLGLPPAPPVEAEGEWVAAGTRGWRVGEARGLLRTGPLRFRPGQADLLHFDLLLGEENALRDAGTGAYNPPADRAWWTGHFASAAAHNLILFDDAEPMPRAGRFLLARWVRTEALPDGAAMRDFRGNRHARRVVPGAAEWRVEDEVSGPFRWIALRWHLAPGIWRVVEGGVQGGGIGLDISADTPLDLRLEEGWESPAYGEVRPIPVPVARARAPVSRVLTVIRTVAGCKDRGETP
ncbi:heparinase II/III family protein [Muricoccus aerilatus]|uniref:heparinase II/III family protein n=1 Tax=Muricoccus aerilatus TaxID=452982 RepID=UPI000694DD02|nr:heparinase II/III-family protein [Roseomonas aerilata]